MGITEKPSRRVLQTALRGARGRPDASGDAGYAVVDAMVALMILAASLILGLEALAQARRVAETAHELRQATTLAVQVMETSPRTFAATYGQTSAFSWRVETRLVGSEGPIEICRRAAVLLNRGSQRAYQTATLEACPLEGRT